MKKALLIIGFLLITLTGFAQEKQALLGKWMFREVYQKENIEAEKAARLTTMFTDMMMEIKDNEALLTMIGRTESAQWSFSEKNPKIINVVSKTGKTTEMEIIKLDAKELVITFGKAGALVLVKA